MNTLFKTTKYSLVKNICNTQCWTLVGFLFGLILSLVLGVSAEDEFIPVLAIILAAVSGVFSVFYQSCVGFGFNYTNLVKHSISRKLALSSIFLSNFIILLSVSASVFLLESFINIVTPMIFPLSALILDKYITILSICFWVLCWGTAAILLGFIISALLLRFGMKSLAIVYFIFLALSFGWHNIASSLKTVMPLLFNIPNILVFITLALAVVVFVFLSLYSMYKQEI